MPVHSQLQLNITDLLVNTSNPRFDPVEQQRDAIEEMIADQQEKLVALARHMVQFGLNPIDPLLVKPHAGQWVVMEGNRRATALKLVNEPSLVPATQPALRRAFDALSKEINRDLLKHIPCVAMEDADRINEWVRLKHTGQNDGAGTVSWDGTQTARFRATVVGKPDTWLEFLDYLRGLDEIPADLKARFPAIMKTNFERLMGDPDVRGHLGIDLKDKIMRPVEGVNMLLLLALEDLSSGDFSVAQIYTKDMRREYLDDLIKRSQERQAAGATDGKEHSGEAPADGHDGGSYGEEDDGGADAQDSGGGDPDEKGDARSGATNVGSTDTAEGSNQKSRHGKKGKRGYPINRKTLVPSSHKPPIGHPRLSRIFTELRKLDVSEYTNAVAVLFRVFVELSSDYYISAKAISKVSVDSSLGKKIDAIADYMRDNGVMTEHELRPIRQMASSPSQTQSVKTFHSYVHNLSVTPVPDDLKIAWDDVWKFIENMWR